MANTTPLKPGNPAGIPVSTRATAPAPAVRYVKRGKFRMPETLPDHQQATRALYDALPVHGLKAATVRELLHSMACALVSLEYRATHHPDRLVGDRDMVPAWYAYYAAQAKAMLYAASVHGDDVGLVGGSDLPLNLPVPAPIVLTADDCRARFLALVNDGELIAALSPATRTDRFSKADRDRMADAVYRLWADLIDSGAVLDRGVGGDA